MIDNILNRECKLGGITFSVLDICFVLAILLLSLVARIALYPLTSVDWNNCLSLWLEEIRRVGALPSIGKTISNYTSPYMYFMSMVSGFDNGLYALKSVSVLFDYIGAAVMFLLVHHLTGNTRKSILAMTALLLCPTVIFNSAWWCQCDIIYTTFILLAFLALFKDRSALCCIFLGIALSFKVQTVLLLPFIVILWLNGRTIKIWHLVFLPAAYLVMHVPALLAGRPLFDCIATYYAQSGYYINGTMKFPNLYVFLNETEEHLAHMQEIGTFGMAFGLMLLGTLAYYVTTRRVRLTDTALVTLALFSVSMALYALPHMHDRYGFMVDLLAIVYAFQRPRKAFVSIGYILVSMLTYMTFLADITVLPFTVLALLLLALDIYVGYDLYLQLRDAEKLPEPTSR